MKIRMFTYHLPPYQESVYSYSKQNDGYQRGKGRDKSGTWDWQIHTAAAAKSLQSYPTLCDPIDSSPPGSPVPGILQARTLEWVAISFSNAWKWKVKVKSLSHVRLFATPWTAGYHTTTYKTDEQGPTVEHRELCSISVMTYNGKEFEKEYTYICETFCCIPETL